MKLVDLMPPKQAKKHILQKISGVAAILCFIAMIVCGVLLAFAGEDSSKVYKASMLASTLFFFMVSAVLRIMATTNLPSFKLEEK